MTWILPKQLHTLASALDTEALISDLDEQSQICAQSLLLRSKPSPARIWSRKWKRDSWTQHLFGRILKPSLGPAFAERWTSCLEATLASPSAPQESDLGRTTQDTCGLGSQTEFAFSNQPSAFSKTSRDTFRWDSPQSSATWKAWVTRSRLDYSRRLKSARLTSAKEFLSWPTVSANEDSYRINGASQASKCLSGMARRGELSWPTASSRDYKGAPQSRLTPEGYNARLDEAVIIYGLAAQANPSTNGSRLESWSTPRATKASNENLESWKKRRDQGKVATMPLPTQVQSWATPKASDPQHSGPNMRDSAGNYALPAQAVRESWATATVSTGAHRQKDGSMIPKLDTQVKTWGTPNARDWMGAPGQACQERGGHRSSLPGHTKKTDNSGKLNPRWVETLMGLPVGWTMPSCASPVTIALMNCASSATE